jgi:hypothetical protein
MRTYKKTKATAKNAEISAITSSFIEFLVAVKMSKDPIVEFLIFIAATMGVFVTAITVTIMMFYLLAVITCSIGDAVMFAMNGIIATGISITVLYDVSKKDEIIVLNAIKEICMSYGSLIMIFIHFFTLIR